jgi:hypothetical protein
MPRTCIGSGRDIDTRNGARCPEWPEGCNGGRRRSEAKWCGGATARGRHRHGFPIPSRLGLHPHVAGPAPSPVPLEIVSGHINRGGPFFAPLCVPQGGGCPRPPGFR